MEEKNDSTTDKQRNRNLMDIEIDTNINVKDGFDQVFKRIDELKESIKSNNDELKKCKEQDKTSKSDISEIKVLGYYGIIESYHKNLKELLDITKYFEKVTEVYDTRKTAEYIDITQASITSIGVQLEFLGTISNFKNIRDAKIYCDKVLSKWNKVKKKLFKLVKEKYNKISFKDIVLSIINKNFILLFTGIIILISGIIMFVASSILKSQFQHIATLIDDTSGQFDTKVFIETYSLGWFILLSLNLLAWLTIIHALLYIINNNKILINIKKSICILQICIVVGFVVLGVILRIKVQPFAKSFLSINQSTLLGFLNISVKWFLVTTISSILAIIIGFIFHKKMTYGLIKKGGRE